MRLVGIASEVQTEKSSLVLFAGRRRWMESGVEYGSIAGITYRHDHYAGFSGPAAQGRSGESLRLSLGVPVWIGRVQGELRHGYSADDNAPSVRASFREIGLRTNLRIAGQSFSASVNRLQVKLIYSVLPQDQTTASINTRMQVAPSTYFYVTGNGTQYAGTPRRTFSTFDAGITQELPFGHRVGWRGRSMSYDPGGAGAVTRQGIQQFEYAMPVGIPVSASDDRARIVAVVRSEPSGQPMEGVLVRVNDEARLTGKNGEATFSSLEGGTHFLHLDQERLGVGRTVTPSNPLAVTVGPNETRRVELRVVGSAIIRGSVRLARYEPTRLGMPDTLVDAGAIPGILVSIGNSGDTVRALVDPSGQFIFRDLHPGHWVVAVVRSGLPARYHLERDRFAFELKAGDIRDVEFRVIPERREIKFIAEAEIRATPAGAPAAAPTRMGRSTRPAIATGWPVADATWQPPSVKHFFTVTRHDISLIQIARYMYNDASLWPKIWLAKVDHLASPDHLRAGQRLRIPDEGPLTPAEIAARNAYFARKR
jgi:hypothetical protein